MAIIKKVILIASWLVVASTDDYKNQSYLICTKKYCLPKDYNKATLPPAGPKGYPLEIKLNYHVTQVTKVDDKEYQLHLLLYLMVIWNESRLLYLGNSTEYPPSMVPLSFEWMEKLWIPDIFVYNMYQGYF